MLSPGLVFGHRKSCPPLVFDTKIGVPNYYSATEKCVPINIWEQKMIMWSRLVFGVRKSLTQLESEGHQISVWDHYVKNAEPTMNSHLHFFVTANLTLIFDPDYYLGTTCSVPITILEQTILSPLLFGDTFLCPQLIFGVTILCPLLVFLGTTQSVPITIWHPKLCPQLLFGHTLGCPLLLFGTQRVVPIYYLGTKKHTSSTKIF